MDEITLVTAFFNIGRENWKGFVRNDDYYVSCFAHWARLRNRLIVYTSPEVADKVRKIRDQYGLEDKTVIIPVDHVFELDSELYHRIKEAMTQKISWLFHQKLANPESWNYNYNYIMALKAFFVQDAVQRNLASGTVAWIDFGFDHGGGDFPHSEEFDFTWRYPFEPYIHLFLSRDLDDTPIFQIVHHMDEYVRGGIIIAPDNLWKHLWGGVRNAYLSLADCGLSDDDQTVLLMVYRRHPELFKLHKTAYWGEALKAYGGDQLTLGPNPTYNKIKDGMKRKMKRYLKKQVQKLDIRRRHGTEIERLYFNE